MKEETAEEERNEILASMTPAFREKLKYFENWLRKEMKHALQARYELGLVAQELYQDETKNGGKRYGRHAIDRICKILRWDDGVIRLALQFVQVYSQEDLERLCAVVLPSGEPLNWSHVRYLIRLNDTNERQHLLEQTITKGWTCSQLAMQIVNMGKRKEGDGRGRPPRKPKTFDDAVFQQQESAERWDRLHSKVWGKPDCSLIAQAGKLTVDEVTEERHYDARNLAIQLRRVANQAVEQAEKAEQVVRDFERILKERQGETLGDSRTRARVGTDR